MNIPLYAKEVWDGLALSSIFGSSARVIDQFNYYIESNKESVSFLEVNSNLAELCKFSLNTNFLNVVDKNDVKQFSDTFYFERRITVCHDIGLVELGKGYYLSDSRADAVDVNLVIDNDGVMTVLYEDDLSVEIGEVPRSSPFVNSKFHVSLVEDEDVFLLIDDIFYYQGNFLSDMKFSERVRILRDIDFDGLYEYCQIVKKKFCYIDEIQLIKFLGYEMEIISPDHIVSKFRGAVSLSKDFKFVVFCSEGKLFAIEWTKTQLIDDIEKNLVDLVKRVKKQKYPILQWVFSSRAHRYQFSRLEREDGSYIKLNFLNSSFPYILRRISDYLSVHEMMHSFFAEMVSLYGVIKSKMVSLNSDPAQISLLIRNYYSGVRENVEVLTVRELGVQISEQYNNNFLLVHKRDNKVKLLHKMSRVRLGRVRSSIDTVKLISAKSFEEIVIKNDESDLSLIQECNRVAYARGSYRYDGQDIPIIQSVLPKNEFFWSGPSVIPDIFHENIRVLERRTREFYVSEPPGMRETG